MHHFGGGKGANPNMTKYIILSIFVFTMQMFAIYPLHPPSSSAKGFKMHKIQLKKLWVKTKFHRVLPLKATFKINNYLAEEHNTHKNT